MKTFIVKYLTTGSSIRAVEMVQAGNKEQAISIIKRRYNNVITASAAEA